MLCESRETSPRFDATRAPTLFFPLSDTVRRRGVPRFASTCRLAMLGWPRFGIPRTVARLGCLSAAEIAGDVGWCFGRHPLSLALRVVREWIASVSARTACIELGSP